MVSYISNSSWTALPSFTVMRQSLLRNFDRIWIENMHGDRTITEYGPDGRSSETVSAIDGFSPGIRQGVATTLLVRTGQEGDSIYRYRDDLDASDAARRRADLLATLDDPGFDARYAALAPTEANRFLLKPAGAASAGYADWPALDTLLRVPPLPGLLEKRGGGLVGTDRARLVERMRGYLDAATFEQARPVNPALATDRAGYDAKKVRAALRGKGFRDGQLQRYCFSAFDMRWAYTTEIPTTWNRVRPQLLHVLPEARGFLALRPQQIADPEGFPAHWTPALAEDGALFKHGFLMPVVENLSGAPRPNLSDAARAYLAALGIAPDAEAAELLLHHELATLYSPAFLSEDTGGIRQGWLRLPLPGDADLLRASAALGARLVALLDPDTAVPGVTAGALRPELAPVAVPVTRPGRDRDWTLQGWGNRTEAGVTMPLRGRVEVRPYAEAEAATAVHAGLLGGHALDIGMNGVSLWRCVPEAIWECRIGGHQVLKKWLSYRDHSIIQRPLTQDGVAHVQQTARRLAAILLMGPDLDESYRACALAHRGGGSVGAETTLP